MHTPFFKIVYLAFCPFLNHTRCAEGWLGRCSHYGEKRKDVAPSEPNRGKITLTSTQLNSMSIYQVPSAQGLSEIQRWRTNFTNGLRHIENDGGEKWKMSRFRQEAEGDDRFLICFVVPSSSKRHLKWVPLISQNYHFPQSPKTWQASENHTLKDISVILSWFFHFHSWHGWTAINS